MQQGIQHHQSGRLVEAEPCYRQLLAMDPGHADANHLLGVIAYQVGQLDLARQLIAKALLRDDKQPLFHLNLGNVFQDQNRLEEAAACYRSALDLNPDFPEAHNNLGNTLRTLGNPEKAISCFQKAISLRPDYAEAHNNLGNTLKDLEQLDKAIEHLHKALELNPAYADAHFNLARALFSDSQYELAIQSCQCAISLKPDFIDAYLNLGIILNHYRRPEEALEAFQKVLVLSPDNAQAFAGRANALRDMGRMEEAMEGYIQSLFRNPDDEETWGNLQQTAKMLLFSGRDGGDFLASLPPEIASASRRTMLDYSLKAFRPHEADESFDKMMADLPERKPLTPGGLTAAPLPLPSFSGCIGLLHFGRSGTGLMHSLIDSHPQISTLPSLYLSGYFNAGIWEELSAEGPEKLPERFADMFAVIFDARSPKPIPGTQKEGLACIGIREGMTAVGENREKSLSVDKDKFLSHAHQLIAGCDRVDAGVFFKIVHAANEYALGRDSAGKTIFYHVHNPNTFAKPNFLRHVPDARLLMMVREPVQSCESWMRLAAENNEYVSMTFKLITMLQDIDQIAFRRHDSRGLRLEDLKSAPGKSLKALAAWMGIEENDSLYQMTAQGEKWWGDPSSPDYETQKEMRPFDEACFKRPGLSIFGERDRLMLETLFHPFRVKFGYAEANETAFKQQLKDVRLFLDEPFEFERAYMERTGTPPDQLRRRGHFTLLRATLTDRLDVLEEYGTYPHMLPPLEIEGSG